MISNICRGFRFPNLTHKAFFSSNRLPKLKSLKYNTLTSDEIDRAKRFLSFVDNSPEPFHVVNSVTRKLTESGFKPLDYTTEWKNQHMLSKGGKYFYTVNQSTIIAFVIGEKFNQGNGFRIIGAHTDSPNLRVKPNSKRSASGVKLLNVETYGGKPNHLKFNFYHFFLFKIA